jgi:lactoylglutathione lyase
LKLAKPVLDVGLYTEGRDAMLAFWQQAVGLAFEETLPAGGGVHQHRHAMNGSVLKLNHARDALPEAEPSGYHELWIARAGADPGLLVDPDGNRVRLVEPGVRGVSGIGVLLRVRNAEAHHQFFGEVLGLERVGDSDYRWGETLIFFEEDAALPADMVERANAKMRAPGYRYTTVQVTDVDAVHADLLARGALEGFAPRTLGQVARISFIRDPDGNWIEISQRATLTGPLGPG